MTRDQPTAADWIEARAGAYRRALAVLRNQDQADEIAQQACSKAFERLDQFQGKGTFVTWVGSIAWRLAIDLWNSLKKTASYESPDAAVEKSADSSANPEDVAASREKFTALFECLDVCTDRQREIFELRRFYGYKYREIADKLGMTTGAVGATLAQVSKKLADCMKGKGVRLTWRRG